MNNGDEYYGGIADLYRPEIFKKETVSIFNFFKRDDVTDNLIVTIIVLVFTILVLLFVFYPIPFFVSSSGKLWIDGFYEIKSPMSGSIFYKEDKELVVDDFAFVSIYTELKDTNHERDKIEEIYKNKLIEISNSYELEVLQNEEKINEIANDLKLAEVEKATYKAKLNLMRDKYSEIGRLVSLSNQGYSLSLVSEQDNIYRNIELIDMKEKISELEGELLKLEVLIERYKSSRVMLSNLARFLSDRMEGERLIAEFEYFKNKSEIIRYISIPHNNEILRKEKLNGEYVNAGEVIGYAAKKNANPYVKLYVHDDVLNNIDIEDSVKIIIPETRSSKKLVVDGYVSKINNSPSSSDGEESDLYLIEIGFLKSVEKYGMPKLVNMNVEIIIMREEKTLFDYFAS